MKWMSPTNTAWRYLTMSMNTLKESNKQMGENTPLQGKFGHTLEELEPLLEGRIVENVSPLKLYQEHISRYIFASKFAKDKIVLDIGSATGYGSNYLAKEAKSAVGLETHKLTINYAKKRYTKENLHFIHADAARLPFPDNCFDVITAFLVIEHLEKYEDFVKECKRVIKNEGHFICATPNKMVFHPFRKKTLININEPHLHFKEFNSRELYELLNSYFTNVQMYGQNNLSLIQILFVFGRAKIFGFGKSVLSTIPKGNVIRRLFRKFIMGYQESASLRRDEIINFNETLSNKQITTLKDSWLRRGKHIIAVCEGKK